MFVLKTLTYNVAIPPSELKFSLNSVIKSKLNELFNNKVVIGKGLGITVFDVLEVGTIEILPGSGNAYAKVKFRHVFFAPFVNEILTGHVKSCRSEGIYVTLKFFDNIIIPASNLQTPSVFKGENSWVWTYCTNEKRHDLWIQAGDEIKFRVTRTKFVSYLPPDSDETEKDAEGADKQTVDVDDLSLEPHYSIEGSIDEPGLGVPKWWLGV